MSSKQSEPNDQRFQLQETTYSPLLLDIPRFPTSEKASPSTLTVPSPLKSPCDQLVAEFPRLATKPKASSSTLTVPSKFRSPANVPVAPLEVSTKHS